MQETQRFSRCVVTSFALHIGIVALALVAPMLFPTYGANTWGVDSGQEGGVRVALEAISGIELPSPPVVREDAIPNDSETLNPSEPAAKTEPKVEEKPDLLIASKTAKPKPSPAPTRGATKTEPRDDPPPAPVNAVPGGGGQPAVPYGQPGASSGQTTFGDAAFGVKYGWYVDAMTRAIKEKWQPGPLRGTTSRLYVVFTISRNGQVSNFRIDQSSGSPGLDSSAEAAVKIANIPKLPPDYLRPSIDVRFYFEHAR